MDPTLSHPELNETFIHCSPEARSLSEPSLSVTGSLASQLVPGAEISRVTSPTDTHVGAWGLSSAPQAGLEPSPQPKASFFKCN